MVERACDLGLSLRMGFEVEWALDRGEGESFRPAAVGPGYGMDRLIEVSDYCRDLLSALAAEAVDVGQLHPEYAPSQFELSLGAADPVAAADLLLLARHTIRAVTVRAGMRCSFAPVVAVGGWGAAATCTRAWRATGTRL